MARLVTIAAACLLAAACQQQDGGSTNGTGHRKAEQSNRQSIMKALAAERATARFAAALKAGGLEDTLSGAQPYTVFAPDGLAMSKMAPGTADALLAPENKARLLAFLTGHIVPGMVTEDDLHRAIERGKGKAQLATVGGSTITVTSSGNRFAVAGPDGAQGLISGGETTRSNGVIHPVDTVLASQ